MKALLVLLLPLLAASCSNSDNSPLHFDSQAQPLNVAGIHPKPLARLYWPLDHTREQKQTLVPALPHCRVMVTTICLNDSAVVNTTTLDTGSALDIAHNYESDLSIIKNGHVWQQERLTKALFEGNATAQALGPLSELTLSFTSFTGYKKPDFLFYTRLGVPDSDVFVEAEVALQPGKGLRLANVREQTPSEPE
jgi:hypothetical protein